ncbi:MAG: NAD(P)-binding domain-containing protein [Polyangiaceae bacterium]
MKIAVLGTGMVGTTIADKLVALGHEVRMGARSADNEKAKAWAAAAGSKGSQGTFADAAAFGELAFNCTLGAGTLDAVRSVGSALDGKILVDISNPLDFSAGMPPTLFSGNTDSLGEQLQRALPNVKVVKALNTINCQIMVDAGRLKGEHDVFMSGNDKEAKGRVAEILRGWFGWKSVIDLGDISTARGTESYLPLWVRLWGALGTADFNIKIVR